MTWLLGKAKFYGLAFLAGASVILAAVFKIKAAGRAEEQLKQSKSREYLQEKYDEVDRQSIDLIAAYERLDRLSDDKSVR